MLMLLFVPRRLNVITLTTYSCCSLFFCLFVLLLLLLLLLLYNNDDDDDDDGGDSNFDDKEIHLDLKQAVVSTYRRILYLTE